MTNTLNNYRLCFRDREYIPIISGGMGVDISSTELAVAVAKEGGIGHISDAMSPFISDRKFGTHYQNEKGKQFQEFRNLPEKKGLIWNSEIVKKATQDHVAYTMSKKVGSGLIFINVMEKLNMGAPRETLKARLEGALDGGIDGITLSAGLHIGTLPLIESHPRFHDALIGVIVSSARALKIFLRTAARIGRLPDYIVVEGPLAGGHLGFGCDWAEFNLRSLIEDVVALLHKENLSIPVVAAGGIFTGTDAVNIIKAGASAVQVATRFTIAKECGLPDKVKQIYLQSQQEEVVVNFTSPTGYPMRMLSSSPSLRSNQRPNCESLGYILDGEGKCSYIDEYNKTPSDTNGRKLPVKEKMCICTHFMKMDCYTCGHYVYRLKETTVQLPNGQFILPDAAHIFNDYLYSEEHQIVLPKMEIISSVQEKLSEEGLSYDAIIDGGSVPLRA